MLLNHGEDCFHIFINLPLANSILWSDPLQKLEISTIRLSPDAYNDNNLLISQFNGPLKTCSESINLCLYLICVSIYSIVTFEIYFNVRKELNFNLYSIYFQRTNPTGNKPDMVWIAPGLKAWSTQAGSNATTDWEQHQKRFLIYSPSG